MFQENRGWKKTGMWRNQHTSADKISNKIIIINKKKHHVVNLMVGTKSNEWEIIEKKKQYH